MRIAFAFGSPRLHEYSSVPRQAQAHRCAQMPTVTESSQRPQQRMYDKLSVRAPLLLHRCAGTHVCPEFRGCAMRWAKSCLHAFTVHVVCCMLLAISLTERTHCSVAMLQYCLPLQLELLQTQCTE